jgi:hypothetical protein
MGSLKRDSIALKEREGLPAVNTAQINDKGLHCQVDLGHVSKIFSELIKETMDLLGCHFEDVLVLFCHVLTTSDFTFSGQFYE